MEDLQETPDKVGHLASQLATLKGDIGSLKASVDALSKQVRALEAALEQRGTKAEDAVTEEVLLVKKLAPLSCEPESSNDYTLYDAVKDQLLR